MQESKTNLEDIRAGQKKGGKGWGKEWEKKTEVSVVGFVWCGAAVTARFI